MTTQEIREAIAKLEAEGLVAAKGTTIESYTVERPHGKYKYYRLCDSKGKFLIHLGNEESEHYKLFREAVQRRQRVTELKGMLKALTKTDPHEQEKTKSTSTPNL